MPLLFFLICFSASTVGAVCGIGGGVIIKPVLDFFQVAPVPVINFLSGCTVLAMSAYSVGCTLVKREKGLNLRLGTPLALGGALGGMAGGWLFACLREFVANPRALGSIQSWCLFFLTLGTLVYTLAGKRIRTHHLDSQALSLAVGFVLGVISSFLGIGGGPINLVVLFYFFSMDAKQAAQNSLYVILFGQAANFLYILAAGKIPAFVPGDLLCMVLGGLAGGISGRHWHRRVGHDEVRRLFIGLMLVIVLVCVYNIHKYGPV